MSDEKMSLIPSEDVSEFFLYQTDSGDTRIQLRLYDGSVWLTQKMLAELYQKAVSTINKHLMDIYDEGELAPEQTIRSFRVDNPEGKRTVSRVVDFYNLDVVIAIGYRVKSSAGTLFRQWATENLKEYLIKGFVLDDERLKSGKSFGDDYFDELLWRIRDIRASERLFYQKITDIYATSADYNPNAEITKMFYKKVQNKMHWAVHGHTAAEVIYARVDASKPHLGLTSWKAGPDGQIRLSDVDVAKNYLTEDEVKDLNLLVTQYLDFAEAQARRRKVMRMQDWIDKLDAFISLNDGKILESAGSVSAATAKEKARAEFEKYEAMRRLRETTESVSDFDRFVEETRQYFMDGVSRGEENEK